MADRTTFITDIERDYPDYLRDESRRAGRADSISFPRTEKELKDHLAVLHGLERPVTIQGARTGVTGGAVPEGGHILNLSRMDRILDLRHEASSNLSYITVQPGVPLSEVQEKVKEFRAGGAYFFPPDVTENSATIGGMAACNASGAGSFFYGPTREFVERLRVVLADGSVLDLKRGDQKADNRSFSLVTDTGRVIAGELPSYRMPEVKNSCGYFARDNMDLVDLFIGSEGTLGIISEIELRLIPAPAARWVTMAFFPSEETSLSFVKTIRRGAQHLVAIEFFGHRGLDLFRRHKKDIPAFKETPEMPPEWHTAVYLEFHAESEEAVENACMDMSRIMEECGGDPDAIWAASNERDIERLKDFRHAVPEAVNTLIDERRKKTPRLTKLGTDMAVPDSMLGDVISLYHAGLAEAGLEYVIFGHIGNNHLHVNILPNSLEEYERGKQLYLEWAQEVIKMGGTVSAEHGIGKLKIPFLRKMYGDEGIRQMQKVKALFDPDNILNRGNLFI